MVLALLAPSASTSRARALCTPSAASVIATRAPLDLGIPGVALGVLFALGLFRAVAAGWDDAGETALALAFTTVAVVYAGLSYNLWHVWWLTMLWLGAAFMLAGSRAGPAGTRA